MRINNLEENLKVEMTFEEIIHHIYGCCKNESEIDYISNQIELIMDSCIKNRLYQLIQLGKI